MERLEISEVTILTTNKNNRCDPEYYQKKYLLADMYLNSKKHFRLGQKLKIADGNHGYVTFVDKGIKYMTAENIRRAHVDINNIRHIDKPADKKNIRSRVKAGDILMSIKGTLGEAAVAESWLLPANMNRDVAVLKPLDKSVCTEYVSLFLISDYGAIQSERAGSGCIQQMITLERLRDFIIVEAEDETPFKEAYRKVQHLIQESKSRRSQAETLVLDALGFRDFTAGNNFVNIVCFADAHRDAGRLDAEFYQKKYTQIYSKLTQHPFTYVQNEFQQVKTKIEKKDWYNYTEISDISILNGDVLFHKLADEELPINAKTAPAAGDLLVSKVRPNRGAVAIVPAGIENHAVSCAFTVLRKKEDALINSSLLQMFLQTELIKDYLLKFNSGTSYPVIKDTDIMNLAVPVVDKAIQDELEQLLMQSKQMWRQSQELLASTVKALEDEVRNNVGNDVFFCHPR